MNCLDEGLLQALLDGELAAEARHGAESHLASCPSCAAAATDAAQEFALFSRAFAVDESLSVPTERLRANVASAVAEMRPALAVDRVAARESAVRRGRSFWSSLAATFAPRQVAVFAGLALAAVVLAATFWALRPGQQPGAGGDSKQIAGGRGGQTPRAAAPVAPTAAPPAVEESDSQGASGGATTGGQVAKITPRTIRPESAKTPPKGGSPQRAKIGPKTIRPAERSPGEVATSVRQKDFLLPVERQYAREIAALRTSIERQKLQTLSPTLRAEYERNVAVVDEAIASTRAAARSNPADRDAQEFLRAAYQEKLDLLSAVAGKSQLASAGR
jgi:hypothetical protein